MERWKSLSQSIQVGKYHQGGQCNNNPGPWPERVMTKLEKNHGTNSVVFIFGRQHTLGYVTTATGL